MTTRRPRGRRRRTCASEALLAVVLTGCTPPSSNVDGDDLLGVFDAGANAAPTARPSSSAAKPKPRASASAVAPFPVDPLAPSRPSVRVPEAGPCIEPRGVAATGLRRVLGRPACRSARVLEWRDAEGSPRYACVVAPPGAATRAPLPLVVFFHAAEDDATAVDKKTALRKLGAETNLTGDPAHAGFVVLAPKGRALGGPNEIRFDDTFTGDTNVDLATTDHFVTALLAEGLVDPARIYALGDREGGAMASLWAHARPRWAAAFGTFASASDPGWTCAGPPPPAFVAYRACDGTVPCATVEGWLRGRDARGAETSWLRLGLGNDEEPHCALAAKCTEAKGAEGRRRWPKGKEGAWLGFFARHRLDVPAPTPPPK